jgi:hypothetical protein
MNTQFQTWFAQGKAVEALCGQGDYFMPDVTYRDDHDCGLAVGELLAWARQGHREDAATAFETALAKLSDTGYFENALRLLRSYSVLQKEMQASLPINEDILAAVLKPAIRKASDPLSRDESLRNLLLLVRQDFPLLKAAIGIK